MMAPAEILPVRVFLTEADYHALLDQAPARSRVAARLVAAERIVRKINRVNKDLYEFTASRTDAVALREISLAHAPEALPAIDLGLKLASEK
jgi:hypothetical protein